MSGDTVELCWSEQKMAVITAASSADLPEWRLVPADEDLVARMRELTEQGVF